MHQLIDKKKNIITYLVLLIILSTTSNKTIQNQKSYLIKIDKINIEGLSGSRNSQLLNELGNIFYRNIFILRKDEIKKIISQHNIVEEYSVKKIYPSKIDISIKTTKIIAKISGNNQLLVGSNGKFITNEESSESLTYIFGEFNSEKFLEFKRNIEISKFNFNDFKAIFYFPSNRWDILTHDGISIKLPENNLLGTLNLAHKIINNDKFKYKKIIDLRVSNKLVTK